MHCLQCHYEETGPITCPHCQRTYNRKAYETYGRIRYLLAEVQQWKQVNFLGAQVDYTALDRRYHKEEVNLERALGVRTVQPLEELMATAAHLVFLLALLDRWQRQGLLINSPWVIHLQQRYTDWRDEVTSDIRFVSGSVSIPEAPPKDLGSLQADLRFASDQIRALIAAREITPQLGDALIADCERWTAALSRQTTLQKIPAPVQAGENALSAQQNEGDPVEEGKVSYAPSSGVPATANRQETSQHPDASTRQRKPAEAMAVPAGHTAPLSSRPPLSRPKRPSFNWDSFWAAFLSERTLQGLLYLGAFLLTLAVAVLVVLNWRTINPVAQVAVLGGIATTLYAGGYGARHKLGLRLGGATLMGIGALFATIALGSLGRTEILHLPPLLTWLLLSLLILPLYAVSALGVGSAFFAILSGLAGVNCVLALTTYVGLPLEWRIVLTLPLLAVYLLQHYRPDPSAARAVFSRPLFLVAQVLGPVGYLLLLSWQFSNTAPVPNLYAVGAYCWGLPLLYLVAFRQAPRLFSIHAAAWLVPVASVLTLSLTPLPVGWYNVPLVALAAGYMLAHSRLWNHYLPEAQLRLSRSLLRVPPLPLVSIVLIGGAVLWPWQTAESRLCVLLALAGSCVWLAIEQRRPTWIYSASALACGALVQCLAILLVPLGWWAVTFAGLALIGLGSAVLVRTHPSYALPLYLSSAITALLTGILLSVYYVPAPACATLPLLLAYAGLSAILIHQQDKALVRFLEQFSFQGVHVVTALIALCGVLFPTWLASVARQLWPAGSLFILAITLGLPLLAVAYLALGWGWLSRRSRLYALPLYWLAIASTLLALLLAAYGNTVAVHQVQIAILAANALVYAALAALFPRRIWAIAAVASLFGATFLGVVYFAPYLQLAFLGLSIFYFGAAHLLGRQAKENQAGQLARSRAAGYAALFFLPLRLAGHGAAGCALAIALTFGSLIDGFSSATIITLFGIVLLYAVLAVTENQGLLLMVSALLLPLAVLSSEANLLEQWGHQFLTGVSLTASSPGAPRFCPWDILNLGRCSAGVADPGATHGR